MKEKTKKWKAIILVSAFLVICVVIAAITLKKGNSFSSSAPSESTREDTKPIQVDTPEEEPTEDITQKPVTDEIEEPVSEEPEEVSILMVGDILLHDPVEAAARDENGQYNFDFIFDDTREYIKAADIAIVNQEVIIGGEELGISGYPAFNAPYEVADALVDAGFDVCCHATNHALDKGAKGVKNTLSNWKSKYPDITVAGINESAEEQDSIREVSVSGINIAILNYTYGTNGIPMPGDMPYAVDMLNEAEVVEDLKKAEKTADLTIVCPHWGTEYNPGISEEQKKWARIFTENGADLIIGTHPHVIEPIEMIDDIPVYYSLGNFVNWTSGTGDGVCARMVGGMAEVNIIKDENDRVTVKDHGVRAIVCHVEPGYQGITVLPLSEYSADMAGKNAIISQDPAFSYDKCISICNDVWGEGYWE